MRVELRLGLILSAMGSVLSRFTFFPESFSSFLCGTFISLGIFFMIVNLVPEKTYNKLLYRKWIASRTN